MADLEGGMAAFSAMVKARIAEGATADEALAYGRSLVVRFADAEVTAAADETAERLVQESGDFVGWEGIVSPGACVGCQENRGIHPLSVVMYRHPNCNCTKQFFPMRRGPPEVIDLNDARRLGGGANETFRYRDTQGREWVLKRNQSGPQSAWTARNELGAQAVNDALGGLVDMPRSYARTIGGNSFTVTEFRAGARSWNQILDDFDIVARKTGSVEISVQQRSLTAKVNQNFSQVEEFDFIIQNADRNQGNYLVDEITGRITAIDHDMAMTPTHWGGGGRFSDATRAAARRALASRESLSIELDRLGFSPWDIEALMRRLTEAGA